MSEENYDDIDALLDITLDDLDDLPSFKPFSPGAHQCTLTLERKKIADHPAIEANLKLIETVEYAEPTDAIYDEDDEEAVDNRNKPGDEASSAYFLDNDIGRGKFKELGKALAPTLGTSVLSEIVAQAKEIEVMVITDIRVDKKDKTKKYLDIKQLDVI